MHKYLSIFLAIAFAEIGRSGPQFAGQQVIPIVSSSHTQDEKGQFSLHYQTGNGIYHAERGILKPTPDGLQLVLVKVGRYSYQNPEGQLVQVQYISDENGFHPISPQIPTTPAPITHPNI